MYNFSSMRREILFILFACVSLTLNQSNEDNDDDDDDMMEGVDDEDIETEDLELFKGERFNISIRFESVGQESEKPIKNCTIKQPDGEISQVDPNLADKFDGRIRCSGHCPVSD